ncbi:MAG: prolyl oligopeptidase family serine peptidase [candidate division Zixibacteria bacterium]
MRKSCIIRFFALIAFTSCLVSCDFKSSTNIYSYPVAHTVDVVDDFHGTPVTDPYRWLEDLNSDETGTWIAEEKAITNEYLENTVREEIGNELTEKWNYARYGNLRIEGDWYIFKKNEGLQNQYVCYKQKSFSETPQILIDPNTFSDDGTVALGHMYFSNDGSMVAYTISQSGSDWREVRIRNVATNEEYEETIRWTKFTSIAWMNDNSGFYYSRYPDSNQVALEDRTLDNKLYFHKLGTDQAEDQLVYEDIVNRENGFDPYMTEDGKYLVLNVWRGTDVENRIYYKKIGGGRIVKLIDQAEAEYTFIENIGNIFYFLTNNDAVNYRIIAIDITKPDKSNWREIIPPNSDAINSASMINNHLSVNYLHNAYSVPKIFDSEGKFIRDIELPAVGTISGIEGKRMGTEMIYSFQSFTYPSGFYHFDFVTGQTALRFRDDIDVESDLYETKQVFFSSKDGTKVPMFIVHKKDLELNGNNPTILNGYGGFNSSSKPKFDFKNFYWLEKGGIYVKVNLRGGGEFGEEWHKAGMLGNKQNVFDDFIAAAEWLIDNKYTSSSKLAIWGGSNGGLLVAVCMIQRPELFGAVVCGVPVIDMLRYHKFTAGRYWTGEYGNAEENPEHFKFLYAYSPLHNIRPGIKCPPIIVTTAESDNRVYPSHSLKFVAALQAADAGDNSILLRYELKAGHGAGKPMTKQINEKADILGFLFKELDM